ncbi:MAG TPA: hypothetical protein PLW93_06010, partial [Candidatus Absconditabacterales bacterium]|nr:hypothetical protein [Candidatus Absconditabacterales bacterium]
GLIQGQFKCSQNEYKIFGLTQTQKGQITRTLENLCRYGYIYKADTKGGHKLMNVYGFKNYDVIAPYFHENTDTRYQTDTKQVANRYESDTKQISNRYSIKNKNIEIDKELEKENLPHLNSLGGGVEGETSIFQERMKKIEKDGQQFVNIWNQKTGRSDFMDDKIKKMLYNMIETVDIEKFTERVETFNKAIQLLKTSNFKKYLYFRIDLFDFGLFLQHINKFYGELEDVFSMLCIDSERDRVKNKIRGILSPPEKNETSNLTLSQSNTSQSNISPPSQETITRMKEIKTRFTNKLTTFTS